MKPEDNTGVEKVIEKVVGIKLNASRLTPMDYEECKKCMQEYSDQQNAELRQSLSELIEANTELLRYDSSMRYVMIEKLQHSGIFINALDSLKSAIERAKLLTNGN